MLTYLLFFVKRLSTKCDDIQHDRFWAVRLISSCHDGQCRQYVDNVDCSGHQDSSWLPPRWWWWWSGSRKVGETAEGLSFGRKWRLLTLIRILLTLLVLSDAIIFVLIFSAPLIIDDCTQMREITQALGMSACLKSEMSNYLELVSFPTVTRHQRNIAQQCANLAHNARSGSGKVCKLVSTILQGLHCSKPQPSAPANLQSAPSADHLHIHSSCFIRMSSVFG